MYKWTYIMKNYLLFSLSFLLLLSVNSAQAAKLSKHITTVIEPEPIKRVAPKYPINAARNNREGWARLSYIIEKDGSVSNVLVTETSGSADFARVSKAAVLKWKFKPAIENGKPIQQCVNSVQMDFKMGKDGEGTKGVTRRFNRKYNQAREALSNKNYVEAKNIITDMFEMKNRHMSENNYLHLLVANYEAAMGNDKQQLFHLNSIDIRLLTNDMKVAVLEPSLVLQIEQGKFHQAYETYTQLTKLNVTQSKMDQYDNIIEKMDAFIGSDHNIIVKANIDNKDYWHYALVRNTFSLIDIKGSLNKLDVRCANKRHVYTVEENSTWEIPKTWKNCSIYVYGEDNTQFNLVEHPIGA